MWGDRLEPRTLAALDRARDEGLPVIVVTGRMVQSVLRVLAPADLREPVICYQGAAVVDPDGEWLLHRPIDVETAREVIAVVDGEGYPPNVYVDDELYVSQATEFNRRYADFQHIELHEVGDVGAWLAKPPTKLVCVGDPDELSAFAERLEPVFGERLWITKSLPYFLEFAALGVSKGSGLEFLAERMGFSADRTVAFGDGENDVELLEWAGYGVAVENAHERVKAVADWICGPAVDEPVADAIDAILDSRS
jgi:Cof subfamily protein (haloacid dehalogenase superfamily)